MPVSVAGYRERGLTLIELLIVLLIVGVLVAITLPSFVNMIERSRIEASTNDLISSLRLARNEAIQQNARVRLIALDGSGAVDEDGNYATGWEVRQKGAASALRLYAGFAEGVTCAACSGEIIFNGQGEAVEGSAAFTLVDGDETRCVRLSRSGGVSKGC